MTIEVSSRELDASRELVLIVDARAHPYVMLVVTRTLESKASVAAADAFLERMALSIQRLH